LSKTTGSSNQGPQIVNPPLVHSVDVRSDGNRVCVGLGDHTARIFEFPSRKHLYTLEAHSATVSQVKIPVFEPLGHLLSGSEDHSIILWCVPLENQQPKSKNVESKNKILQQTNGCNSNIPHQALKIDHGAKINWLVTASTNCQLGNIFVADPTENITVYKIHE